MNNKYKGILEFTKDSLLLILVLVLIQSFIMMKTEIPTGSMIPTININDQLLVTYVPMYYRDPKIGEIVVFKQDNERMIKRVIAGPGQEINIQDGYVYIDGVKQQESYVATEGATYPYDYSRVQLTYPYIVPEDSYFMMGDNRQNSMDSRDYGPVKRDQMSALAGLRVYPFDNIGLIK